MTGFFALASLEINAFTPHLLQSKFNLSSVEAGSCYGYMSIVAGIWLVLTGLFADSHGHLGLLTVFGTACALAGNLWWVLQSN